MMYTLYNYSVWLQTLKEIKQRKCLKFKKINLFSPKFYMLNLYIINFFLSTFIISFLRYCYISKCICGYFHKIIYNTIMCIILFHKIIDMFLKEIHVFLEKLRPLFVASIFYQLWQTWVWAEILKIVGWYAQSTKI